MSEDDLRERLVELARLAGHARTTLEIDATLDRRMKWVIGDLVHLRGRLEVLLTDLRV